VAFFSASWSEESKVMSNVVDELVKDHKYNKSTRFLKIEAENFEDLCIKYGIDAVPSFLFLKNKESLHKMSGADATEFRKKLDQYHQMPIAVQSDTKVEDLNKRLESLINTGPVTLFMKGTPEEPRCGFSKQAIQILKDHNASFSFFDILSDNEVREGLRKYSNWPTYPQLYIKGELIGGLDIIKELVQNGELKDMLPKEGESLNEKLKRLINKSKIMLFMKGDRNQPKCGFSKQILEILNGFSYDYETFDILSDEEVRQGLKEFSNWPTYPQLYVDGKLILNGFISIFNFSNKNKTKQKKGELIGGLDLVKELKAGGELDAVLKGK
jgi:Grx4 family monothiol glutaredoxin